MAGIKRRQLKRNNSISNSSCNLTGGESPKKRVKRKPKRKYRSREVSPCWRSRYGCGRLHWNMRNHGYIDIRRSRRPKRNAKQAVKGCEKADTAAPVDDFITSGVETVNITDCQSSNIQNDGTVSMNTEIIPPAATQCSEKDQSNLKTSDDAMDCDDECILNNLPELNPIADSIVLAQILEAESQQTDTVDTQRTPADVSSATADSSVQVTTQTHDRGVSCRLIYDECETTASNEILKAEGVTDDSLRDVTTVPENEILLPPLFPWREDNTNNNNNIKSIRELTSSYTRGGNLPFRRCAMYATIRIHQMYNPSNRRRKRNIAS